jgi:hypothetical protein
LKGKCRIDIIYSQSYYEWSTENSKNKQKQQQQQQQKLKQSKTKANLFAIYERLKLICTCKWPIDLSEFDFIIIS